MIRKQKQISQKSNKKKKMNKKKSKSSLKKKKKLKFKSKEINKTNNLKNKLHVHFVSKLCVFQSVSSLVTIDSVEAA